VDDALGLEGGLVNFHGVLREGGRDRVVSLTLKDGVGRGTVDGEPVGDLAVERRGAGLLLRRGGAPLRAVAAVDGDRVLVHLGGRVHEVEVAGSAARREKGGKRAHAGDDPFVASPMTGTVVEIPVKPGDAVPKGGTLAVVEAMKMQFVVKAPRDVVVKAVPAEAGKPVDIGAVLVEFEE